MYTLLTVGGGFGVWRFCVPEGVTTGQAARVVLKYLGGKFRWPAVRDGVIRLTAAQLSALLEGLDWRRVHEARETTAPTVPS